MIFFLTFLSLKNNDSYRKLSILIIIILFNKRSCCQRVKFLFIFRNNFEGKQSLKSVQEIIIYFKIFKMDKDKHL